jgi:Skp family chaperone for outer membrane proteins
MKVKQLILSSFVLLMLTGAVFAQSDKIALVETNAFSHPQTGIARLIKAIESVDREFEPRRLELSQIYSRMTKIIEQYSYTGHIPTDPRPMTPERRKELKAQAETMQRSFKRKEAEFQLAHSKRTEEVTAPILQDIRRSLESFAKLRGITLLLDASKMACVVGCDKQATAKIDITQEFIAEYNRLNP